MSNYIATDADGTITLYHQKPIFLTEDLGKKAFWGGENIKAIDYEVLVYPTFPVYVKNAARSLRKANNLAEYKFKPKYENFCTKFAQNPKKIL